MDFNSEFWETDMRYLLLLSAALMIPDALSQTAPEFSTYTHIYTPIELKSVSSVSNAYKVASVCFIGFGECGKIGFSKGDDTYERKPEEMCKEEGYHITSCTIPFYLSQQCPYHENYYRNCTEDKSRACLEAGYSADCPSGQIADSTCPFDSSFKKCKCNPCSGYDYSYIHATAEGYVTDGSCFSCSMIKYKRKTNPCIGFYSCECGGEIGTSTCKSGNVIKFANCKSCCANECTYPSCPSGYSCRYEACSGKYCLSGCAVNYTDWCTPAITDCATLGYQNANTCAEGGIKCPYGNFWHCYEGD